ncbi:DUF3592 domain-containing protein [Prosthecobacter sp.]|uniref:DUF3592 domain-containing protein n=1 Tax=Prosthecobacter sp. TaxID=1965333 RepID=UPI002AB945C1|nr:DUF3592 domain-containing protein [Prosthecobacter sp.]MDZ4404138.1 DUF3592 domain-containing protein [Prosthecobacter sp.]
MIEVLIGLLVPVLIVGAMIFIFVRRGLQMRELCEHGVETTGQIVEKRVVKAGKSTSKQWKIVYRYTDSAGATHSHTSVVSIEAYQNHEEGGPIQVVYSAKRPVISAPKYLVDQARKALGK